ncbi:putative Aromatic-ring hydroxylase [Bosea sp. LC85]|uniref:FAD-dependent monooxygenase n=1 Tax=Bosea sp. LC85 TaxID=1502851 RepID=UPI0004E2B3E3|nr:FAD-dependent monooxygenase [Bosea sp. LC85]KFC64826.1 putative Aromatic-ring hydroxylase [Bosea sp. LC85]
MIRRIGVLGGGPAGLYLALLVRRRRPDIAVRVVERSPADATWGFGVVLADGGLRQLAEADHESFQAIQPHLHPIPRQVFTVHGENVPIDKARSGGAIERLRLLQLLQAACRSSGVDLQFETPVDDLAAFDDCDVVIGADGSNSLLRERFAGAFGTQTRFLTNRFAWFGVNRAFDSSHLNFKTLPGGGALCGHYYAYAPERSTFVMECDDPSWTLLGLEVMTDAQRRRTTQAFFAAELGGHELVENNSIWRRFPVVTNRRWHHDRYVLVGDALRTAHFSIGSGTRMALEDAIALAGALAAEPTREAAFARYVATREGPMAKLTSAAQGSFDWYERFSEKMKRLEPAAFALSFLRRTGRISDERMLRDFPDFLAYAARKGVAGLSAGAGIPPIVERQNA